MMARLFRKKHSSRTNNTQAMNSSPKVPVVKEKLVFKVAVMGYTLKNYKDDNEYEKTEILFLEQIKGDDDERYPISKTYVDIAKEADVIIKLGSDNDPSCRYECGRPNRLSSFAHACIMFYDPTKEKCLVNLKSYFNMLLNDRERCDGLDPIVFLVGINGDKPEKHLFNSSEILNLAPIKLSICPISLNSQVNLMEDVNIIIKNLAIACLKEYQNESDHSYTITASLTKLSLTQPHALETAYSLFSTLNHANKQRGRIHGHILPKELIQYMALLFIQHELPTFHWNPQLHLNIYNELLKDERDHSPVKLVTPKK